MGIKGFHNSKNKLGPVGFDLLQKINFGLGVQCLTNRAKLAFAFKSETFRSLYSYVLLILSELSKWKKWSGAWKISLKIP